MITTARTLLILGLVLGANATNNAEEEATTNSGWGGVAAGDSTTVVSGGDTAAATAAATPRATADVKMELDRPWFEDLANMSSDAAVALARQITDALDTQYAGDDNYIRSVVKALREAFAKRMRRTTPGTEADVEIEFAEAVTQAAVQADLTTFAENSDLVTGTEVAEVAVSGARFLVASALALILPVIARAL